MRNRSIFFPLVMIVLGVVFLARELFPEFYWLRNLHLFWPVLLIAWGVLMLARRAGFGGLGMGCSRFSGRGMGGPNMGGPGMSGGGMRPPDVQNL